MSGQQFDEEAIYSVAVKITDPSAQSQYLDQICAGDVKLRIRVDTLLKLQEKEHDSQQSPLDHGTTVGISAVMEGVGATVGNYKLLKKGQNMEGYLEVKTPTLMIWGKKDIAIGPVGVEGTTQYMKGSYEYVELDASHWLMQEAFEECYTSIKNHLAKYK